MNRRKLKKNVNYLCGELLAECVALVQYESVSQESVGSVMESILMMQADIISRISHVEPGSHRLFFKKLREDLEQRTSEIIDDIQGLG